MREHAHSPLLDWRDGQPFSSLYSDVYFSRDSGLEETRHVFLGGNDLDARWTRLAPRAQFVIGETGFGTGLNFVCAWALWQRLAPRDARLHFVSVERHPLASGELARALSLWPELERYCSALLAQWGDLLPGWHRFAFDGSRVMLTLAIGDVRAVMPRLDAAVDAWFLDGFAPAKNPEMWGEDVMVHVARCSRPRASCATYSVAADVRRNLAHAGFAVAKRTGFGAKREMLQGTFLGSPIAPWRAPWFARPPAAWPSRHAAIIGGGLAGAATAAGLAARGWTVELVERHAHVGAEASGNPQAVLHAQLSPHDHALGALVAAGFQYACRMRDQLPLERQVDFDSCGVLQLAHDEAESRRHARLAASGLPESVVRPLDRAEAAAAAGIELAAGGLLLPQSGWIDLAALCRVLVTASAAQTHFGRDVVTLSRSDDTWQVADRDGPILEAPVVILCSPIGRLLNPLPLRSIRGQLTLVPANSASRALRVVLSGEGYVTPARSGFHSVGATHKFHDESTIVNAHEHAENLARLARLCPPLEHALAADSTRLRGWAAVRWSTPDYLPLVGPLVDATAFAAAYAPLARDAKLQLDTAAPWLDGLYVNTAHGSRGSITAPLAAEILAAYLDDEPAPLPHAVMDAVHPSRFLLRRLIRRQRQS